MSKKAAIAAAQKAFAAQNKIEVPRDSDPEHMSQVEGAHSDFLQAQGRAILGKLAEAGKLYLELVLYIRKNSVGPKLVATELMKLGFKKGRVSEINRVAQSSDAVFSEWQAKRIGFHQAVDMARAEKPGTKPKATPAAGLLTEGASEMREAIKGEESEGSGVHATQSPAEKMKSHAMWILKNYKAPAAGKTWTSKESAFKLTITPLPKSGPSVGDDVSDNDGGTN